MDKTNVKKKDYEKPEVRKVVLQREQTIVLGQCDSNPWKS